MCHTMHVYGTKIEPVLCVVNFELHLEHELRGHLVSIGKYNCDTPYSMRRHQDLITKIINIHNYT